MKKTIMSFLDKRTNRLSRLSEYRKTTNLTTENSIGTFEIEISPKAKEKLKKIDKKIFFSFEHDFGIGIKEKTSEHYWVRVNNECPNKKTDFSYLSTGFIKNSQHSGLNDWGIQVVFNHIDVVTTWGQLNALVEMLAKWIDKEYGEDCGFKDKWLVENMKIDFIKNKKATPNESTPQ